MGIPWVNSGEGDAGLQTHIIQWELKSQVVPCLHGGLGDGEAGIGEVSWPPLRSMSGGITTGLGHQLRRSCSDPGQHQELPRNHPRDSGEIRDPFGDVFC